VIAYVILTRAVFAAFVALLCAMWFVPLTAATVGVGVLAALLLARG